MTSRRIAVVTGAARGIGKSIALRFAKDGYNTVVSDLPNNPCSDILETAIGFGVECFFIPCDIRDEEQVQALIKFALDKFKRLDVVRRNTLTQFQLTVRCPVRIGSG